MEGMIVTDSSFIDLINQLPMIIGYVVNGYIFISVLYFIARFKRLESNEKIVTSLVTSYLLNMIYGYTIGKINWFNKDVFPVRFFWASFLTTFILAFIIGNILKTKLVNDKMLNCKFIKRSIVQDFWQDEFVEGVYYRFHIKDSDVLFEGQVIDREEDELRPFVRIDQVRVIREETDKVVHDYNSHSINKEDTNTFHRTMLINLEEVDYIMAINTDTTKIDF